MQEIVTVDGICPVCGEAWGNCSHADVTADYGTFSVCKFVFLSRHLLTQEQVEDLKLRGFDTHESVNPGVLSSYHDVIRLMEEHKADAYGLVAPGRIWCDLMHYLCVEDGRWYPAELETENGRRKIQVFEAESRQAPELRKGDGPTPFVHVKWHRVI